MTMRETKLTADLPDANRYRGYADLARAQVRGRDFEISVTRRRFSRIAVIAPHAGGIEDGTSAVAREIAGEELNLYLLEGLRPRHNFRALHLTSHRFDEPECLALIAGCTTVIAVHGCAETDERLFLGGRDTLLRDRLAAALRAAGTPADTLGHRFPALHPRNICNRGATGRGVQLELSQPLRRTVAAANVVAALRSVLLRFDRANRSKIDDHAPLRRHRRG